MRKQEKAIMVLTRAMEWYKLNVSAGSTKHSFLGQSRRLWDACVAYDKALKK